MAAEERPYDQRPAAVPDPAHEAESAAEPPGNGGGGGYWIYFWTVIGLGTVGFILFDLIPRFF